MHVLLTKGQGQSNCNQLLGCVVCHGRPREGQTVGETETEVGYFITGVMCAGIHAVFLPQGDRKRS